MNSLLSVKMLGVTTTQGKSPYTMYEMEVSGSILEPYVLFKRYSDFHSLHTNILKLVQSDDKLKQLQEDDTLIIPELPKKQYFNKTGKKVVEDRQHKLQFYLRTLLKSDYLCKTSLIMEFLSVPKAWLHIIEPKKEEIRNHNRKQAQLANDRRLKEQEEQEMKLALALSASLAEANINKEKQHQYTEPTQQTVPSPSSSSLPHGWSVFRTADGRTYYANDITKETTWDKPALHNVHNNNNNNDSFDALSQQYQPQYVQQQQQQHIQPQRMNQYQYKPQQQPYSSYTAPSTEQQTHSSYAAPSTQQPQSYPSYTVQSQTQSQQQTQPQTQVHQTYSSYVPPSTQQPQPYAAPSTQQRQSYSSYVAPSTQPQTQLQQPYPSYIAQSAQRQTQEPYSSFGAQSQPQNVQQTMWGSTVSDYKTESINNMDELVNYVNGGRNQNPNNGNEASASNKVNNEDDLWNMLQNTLK